MITYHAEKLGDIRTYSADWRDCLLEIYVHLRDAEKNKFFSESMTRTLWRQGPATAPSGRGSMEDDNPSGTKRDPGEGEDGRCTHCRRRSVHEGTTKANCPLKDFTANGARTLIKSFSDAKAKMVIAEAVKALAKDKGGDTQAIIKQVRAAHGKDD